MLKSKNIFYTILLTLILGLFAFSFMPVSAGNLTLSLNNGSSNVRWYITGESSLVINGFDLDTLKVPRPTQVDRISLSVITATGGNIEAVVYQDVNGGSPVDAKLVGRRAVAVSTPGVATVTFDPPLTITDRFLWVGFYLPVGFEFASDASGSSTLTYWGWTPNSTFDLANLSSASVFGPSDGSAPVNINLNGIARITADVITTGSTATLIPGATPVATAIGQIQGDASTSLSPMVAYNDCGTLYYDRDDISITYAGGVSFHCKVVPSPLKPESPAGYNRQGPLYDVYVFGIPSGTVPLPFPVTHCLKPRADEVGQALIALGQGAPREWRILPTVRFGDLVCAELDYAGFVSYVIPK